MMSFFSKTWNYLKEIFHLRHFDQIISGGAKKQLTVYFQITFIFLVFFALITLLFPEDTEIYGIDGKFNRIKGVVYHFFDPGGLPVETNSNFFVRLITFLTASFGMVLIGGLLVTTLTNIVERRIGDINNGKVVYKDMTDHYVIIGYGDITISIIRTIYDKEDLIKGKKVIKPIIIFTRQNIQNVRTTIFSQLPNGCEKSIYFYSGDIQSEEHLRNLNIDRAKEVYILGEKNEYGRDSKNLECVKTIATLRGECHEILTVNVQFDKLTSYSIIQRISLSDEFLRCNNQRTIYFRPFNFYENWARMLWGFKSSYNKLDFENISGNKTVHLIIVGFSRMGRALLMEALRQCHYPNFIEKGDYGKPHNKTKITIIDKELDTMLPEFLSQYPYLHQISDIDIEYLNNKIEDTEIRKYLVKKTLDPNILLTIAICLEDPDIALSTGLCLPDEVFYKLENGEIRNTNTQVLIRQSLIQEGIGELLEKNNDKYKNVHIFGMSNKGLCKELMNDDLAMYVNAYYETTWYNPADCKKSHIVIEEYKKYISSFIESDGSLENKDFIDWISMSEHRDFMHGIAKRLWLNLSEDMRFSNRYQVDMYDTYIKYYSEDISKLKQMEHLRWNADRSIIGYKYESNYKGKSPEYKFHHLIVPFYKILENDRTNHLTEEKKDWEVIKNMERLLKLP